jgi:hypothetical protein
VVTPPGATPEAARASAEATGTPVARTAGTPVATTGDRA